MEAAVTYGEPERGWGEVGGGGRGTPCTQTRTMTTQRLAVCSWGGRQGHMFLLSTSACRPPPPPHSLPICPMGGGAVALRLALVGMVCTAPACRGLYPYPELGMLVAGRADGRLLLLPLPRRPGGGPPAVPPPPPQDSSSCGSSPGLFAAAAAAAPVALRAGTTGAGIGASGPGCYTAAGGGGEAEACAAAAPPPTAGAASAAGAPTTAAGTVTIRAHQGRMAAMDGCGLTLVTSSAAGGIKVGSRGHGPTRWVCGFGGGGAVPNRPAIHLA